MADLMPLGSAAIAAAVWSGALLFLLVLAAFWLIDLGDRMRARRQRRRHPREARAFEAAQSAAPAIPTLRAGRPRFRLGPLRRYLSQGRANPIDRGHPV